MAFQKINPVTDNGDFKMEKKKGPKGPHVWTDEVCKQFAKHLYDGMTYQQISRIMGKPARSLKTVKWKFKSIIAYHTENLMHDDNLKNRPVMNTEKLPLIDINKQYRTKKDDEVIIYSTNGGGKFPVHGAIKQYEFWVMTCWTERGINVNSGDNETLFDLIEVKQRLQRTFLVAVRKNVDAPEIFPLAYADKARYWARADGCVVQMQIDCEEGKVL